MNKAELIDIIASSADLPKTTSAKVLDAVLDTITETLAKGDMVSLIGFGVFSAKVRASRIGRNPKTGKKIQIAETKVPSFKPGKVLKSAVNAAIAETEEVIA